MSNVPTISLKSGLCYTFFAVILSGLLILALVVLSRYLTIEKHLKNQFRSPSQEYYTVSPDRCITPAWTTQAEIHKDLSQVYYYHDCCYRNHFQALPGTLIKKIQYIKNKKNDSPSVTIFRVDDIVYCICRSTKTKWEMKKDVELFQISGIHAGFRDIYNDVSPTVFATLEAQADVRRYIIFGHSLGGAIVDLISHNLIDKYPEIWSKTFAFSSGSPRVYTPELSDVFSFSLGIDRYIKLINEADMVNFLPVTVTVTGGLFRDGKKYFYKSFSNQTRIYRFNDVKETQILDSHVSKTYSDNLWNLEKGSKLPLLEY